MHSVFLKWLTSEPVRSYLYAILVPLVALLVAGGIVSGALAPFIVAVVVAVLGGATVETVRSAVSPAVKEDK